MNNGTNPIWGRHKHMRKQTRTGSILIPQKREPVIFPNHTSTLFIMGFSHLRCWVLLTLMFCVSLMYLCQWQSQLISDVWRAEKHQLTLFHLLTSSRCTVTLLSSGFQSDNTWDSTRLTFKFTASCYKKDFFEDLIIASIKQEGNIGKLRRTMEKTRSKNKTTHRGTNRQ